MKINFKLTTLLLIINFSLFITNCDEAYGKLGGADLTTTYESPDIIERIIDRFRGEWYSHYGARRLDSYRVGHWRDRESLIPPDKLAQFPLFDINAPKFREIAATINDDDYFIFYDDTVYGEGEDGSRHGGGWNFNYIGIVRAVNVFNDNRDTGAIIIEYLDGAYPSGSAEVINIPLPFFGIHYRVINQDCVQMANPIDLVALSEGREYYTETATLEDAVSKNTASNNGELISWGAVTPQVRER
jgi:hypothetical protein